jgi:hypothetical protein
MIDVSGARWRKSSRSGGNGGDCVEVTGDLPDGVAVRDSKDPTGPVLVFMTAEWAAFVAGVKEGHFDAG